MNKYDLLLNDRIDVKRKLTENNQDILNSLLNKFILLEDNLANSHMEKYEELLVKSKEGFADYQKIQLERSTDFNCLAYFNIFEPLHSYLLGDLLTSSSSHGQGKLFLNIFLKMLTIPDFEKGRWIVATEKNKVDIILTRRESKNVIIIENKSNNAPDQLNQLYRYWYYNIFQNFKSEFPKEKLSTALSGHFKIIYLVPNNWKKPEIHSLTKPATLYDESAPEKLPKEWITIWNYDLHINNLVEEALKGLNESNHRLREYLIQYREIITNLN